MPHLPHLARDVVLDVRVHPALEERSRHSVLLSQAILEGVLTVQRVRLNLTINLNLISSLLLHLAHAKDEVLHNSLIKLADCAQVEHRVDRADRVTPFPLVPNSCLSRKQI